MPAQVRVAIAPVILCLWDRHLICPVKLWVYEIGRNIEIGIIVRLNAIYV